MKYMERVKLRQYPPVKRSILYNKVGIIKTQLVDFPWMSFGTFFYTLRGPGANNRVSVVAYAHLEKWETYEEAEKLLRWLPKTTFHTTMSGLLCVGSEACELLKADKITPHDAFFSTVCGYALTEPIYHESREVDWEDIEQIHRHYTPWRE